MNHSSGGGAIEGVYVSAFYNMNKDGICLQAFNGGKKGTECFHSYGSLPNHSLLCYYGFAVEDNPNDIAKLTLELEVRLPRTLKGSGKTYRLLHARSAVKHDYVEVHNSLRPLCPHRFNITCLIGHCFVCISPRVPLISLRNNDFSL